MQFKIWLDYKRKKRWWYASELNPGLQDCGCQRIHWALCGPLVLDGLIVDNVLLYVMMKYFSVIPISTVKNNFTVWGPQSKNLLDKSFSSSKTLSGVPLWEGTMNRHDNNNENKNNNGINKFIDKARLTKSESQCHKKLYFQSRGSGDNVINKFTVA